MFPYAGWFISTFETRTANENFFINLALFFGVDVNRRFCFFKASNLYL